MTQRNPLDRSVAFTALLELHPGFGQLETRAASVMTGRFLEDFYASGSKDMGAYARTWMPSAVPTHVVVDTRDGYTFARDHRGALFTAETAREMADLRDAELHRDFRTYKVFALTEVPA